MKKNIIDIPKYSLSMTILLITPIITTIIISIFTLDFNVSTLQILVLWIVTFFVLWTLVTLTLDNLDYNTLDNSTLIRYSNIIIISIFFLIFMNPYKDMNLYKDEGTISKDMNISYKTSNMLIFSLYERTNPRQGYLSLTFNKTQTYVGILGVFIGTIDNYYPKGMYDHLSVKEKLLMDLEYNFHNHMVRYIGKFVDDYIIIDRLQPNLKKLYLKAFGTKSTKKHNINEK